MIDTPMDLMAAIAFILEKEQLPDDWSAEDWESLDGDFKSRAFVSSKVHEARLLDRAQGLLFDHIAEVRDEVETPRGKETVLRVGGKADFVRAMREFMIDEGMATEEEMCDPIGWQVVPITDEDGVIGSPDCSSSPYSPPALMPGTPPSLVSYHNGKIKAEGRH
jgi:hypothetical protein